MHNKLNSQKNKWIKPLKSKQKSNEYNPNPKGKIMQYQIIMSSDPAGLKSSNPHITVEAEYGSTVVEGSLLTLAHHAPQYRSNPPPCCVENQQIDCDSTIIVGISHIDLDTVGGVMAALGCKPPAKEFWDLAGYADLNGPHVARKHPLWDKWGAEIETFWAWQEEHAPRSIAASVDVTIEMIDAMLVILAVIPRGGWQMLSPRYAAFAAHTEPLTLERRRIKLLYKRSQWKKGHDEAAAKSFVAIQGDCILRQGEKFLNAYYDHENKTYSAISAIDIELGKITLSFYNDEAAGELDAAEIMKMIFGPEAGGHKLIAGSPRNKAYTMTDAQRVCETLLKLQNNQLI
jgi:hypothetical protein